MDAPVGGELGVKGRHEHRSLATQHRDHPTVAERGPPDHPVGPGGLLQRGEHLHCGAARLDQGCADEHRPQRGTGQATDISITAKEIIKIKAQLNEILSKHTGREKAVVEKDTDRNNYMNATEAIEYGLVDSILRRDDGKATGK